MGRPTALAHTDKIETMKTVTPKTISSAPHYLRDDRAAAAHSLLEERQRRLYMTTYKMETAHTQGTHHHEAFNFLARGRHCIG